MRSPLASVLCTTIAPSVAAAALLGLLVLLALAPFGCGGPEKEGRYPKRLEGCEVQIFTDSPSMPTDNIGSVDAICGADISDDACLRTLKDQVCKLGGDVAWGVTDAPSVSLGKKKLSGRAAHTKTAGPAK